ncbi:MAG: addiction module killer protein [Comamonadaceae bacterium]|nr:MAG: addiction module killer protein [Comamonadaceae bacterium]
MIELRRYQLEDNSTPVTDWLRGLRDMRARAQIEVRLRRVSTGNFGDCKAVGEGVSELRVDIGSGYRVYYGKHGQTLVILLCGATKVRSSQTSRKPKLIGQIGKGEIHEKNMDWFGVSS